MATRLPVIVDAILARLSTAVTDCEVVDSWAAATTFGKTLTVGVPDMNVQSNGGFTQPSFTTQRGTPGYGPSQDETPTVWCLLEVPAGDGEPTPSSVRTEAYALLDVVIAALADGRPPEGIVRWWVGDDEGYQADLAAGWGVAIRFPIHCESYT